MSDRLKLYALITLLTAMLSGFIFFRKAQRREQLMKKLRDISKQIGSLLTDSVKRSDSHGDGSFGAPRTHGTHHGIDLQVSPGDPVFAPFPGLLKRIAYPYADDLSWQGFLLQGTGEYEGLELKVFYLKPIAELIGTEVRAEQLIGYAQAISERYGPDMQDHIHAEMRVEGELIDPEPYLT